MKNFKKLISIFLIIFICVVPLTACNNTINPNDPDPNFKVEYEEETNTTSSNEENSTSDDQTIDPDNTTVTTTTTTSYDDIPSVSEWDGENAWVTVNNNIPYFTDEEKQTSFGYEYYSDLDDLGRCGPAIAVVGTDIMPTEDREDISSVKPTGWHNEKYDIISNGGWLYNRCHLIAFQLAGENANEKNLITGTRYFNIDGMTEFENMVADYVHETDNHVLYRVTPIFEDDNLVADGVLMEGYSIEDEGESIEFCTFAFNVQPGIEIDYKTGENKLA